MLIESSLPTFISVNCQSVVRRSLMCKSATMTLVWVEKGCFPNSSQLRQRFREFTNRLPMPRYKSLFWLWRSIGRLKLLKRNCNKAIAQVRRRCCKRRQKRRSNWVTKVPLPCCKPARLFCKMGKNYRKLTARRPELYPKLYCRSEKPQVRFSILGDTKKNY